MKKTALILFIIACAVGLISCEKEDKFSPNYSITKSVGAASNDLLSASKYRSLLIEVQAVKGFSPKSQTLENLKSFLNSRLNKPDGITVILKDEIDSPGNGAYSINDIISIERANRKKKTEGSTLTVFVLFVDGHSVDDNNDGKILGHAYYNTSTVIYEKTVHSYSSNPITQPSRENLETAVLNHEIGHLLGLVNVGSNLTSNHQDVPHGKHCNNENCLMYWTADTSNIIENLLKNPAPGLDSDCINDLRANGGK